MAEHNVLTLGGLVNKQQTIFGSNYIQKHLSLKSIGMKRNMIIEGICFLFILLFTYAAVMKLMDLEKFQVQLGLSPLITSFASWVAWIIPSSEIVISLLLLVPTLRLFALYAAFALMVMFTAYIIAITQFSFFVPCSCGGVLQSMGWTEHLYFNSGFVLLGAVGIALQSKEIENKNKSIPQGSLSY